MQGAPYYEKDGYYQKDDPAHREASALPGRGAEEFDLSGPVDPEIVKAVLEGKVPDGSGCRIGRMGKDGGIAHRPGRDLTFSAPKSVSLAALIGGDARIEEAHDRAVKRTLAWAEKNVAETRMKDPETGRMIRAAGRRRWPPCSVTIPRAISTRRSIPTRCSPTWCRAEIIETGNESWRFKNRS